MKVEKDTELYKLIASAMTWGLDTGVCLPFPTTIDDIKAKLDTELAKFLAVKGGVPPMDEKEYLDRQAEIKRIGDRAQVALDEEYLFRYEGVKDIGDIVKVKGMTHTFRIISVSLGLNERDHRNGRKLPQPIYLGEIINKNGTIRKVKDWRNETRFRHEEIDNEA